MIGKVLDKYEILQKIGEGGMASVYRGRHVTLGRDVAIKILHPHLSSAERNRQRFAREARAIENLHHDNILRIYDYSGEQTRDCYIVTEFVDGRTLQELLADHGALPSEVVAQVGIRLAEALEYAHGLGIIHRDLKPENVMVRRDGTVKLMDFGIARFLDEMHLTVTGALVGSPAYMSPEQAMERVLDPRSDLFSLGTLLFHLVTGQLPYTGNNPSIVLRNIIEGRRPGVADLAPEVSGLLADLIHALLQTDPDDRPRTAAIVRQRLAAVLDEVELDPEDTGWSLQTWLVDPEGYRQRLDAHLGEVLLRRGKERLEARDHLGALQLFNRLLSVDEDNAEVLALVQGMHASSTRPAGPGRWWAGGLALLALAGGLTWLLWPSPPEPAPPTPTRSEPGVAAPPAEVVAPTPGTDAPAPPPTEGAAPGTDDEPVEVADPQPAATPPAQPPAVAARGKAAVPIVDRVGPAPLRVAPPGTSARAEPAAAEPGPPEGSADEPGYVTVYVPGSWGDIYIDDVYKARTGARREPIEVSPGTHKLTVRNTYAFDHEERFTVAPGETVAITTPVLQRKPAVVTIGDQVPGECGLGLDGRALGDVSALGRKLTVPEPEQRHEVELRCATGTTRHTIGPLMPGDTVRIP